MADSTPRSKSDEATTAELIGRLSDDLRTLVRDEIRLAGLEIKRKGKRAGIGAGMFGGAGLVAAYGLGALIAGAVLALGLVVPHWAAALIVGAALLVIAGALALFGRNQIGQATPPVPEKAIQGIREDVDAVRGGKEA